MLVPIAGLLCAACGGRTTDSGGEGDTGSTTESAGTDSTSAQGTSDPGTSSASGSTGATGTSTTTSISEHWPDCLPDADVNDTIIFRDLESTDVEGCSDHCAEHDCTVTAVTDARVDFDCISRDDLMAPSTPWLDVDTSSPVTLPFAIDQVVRLRYRGLVGIGDHYAIQDDAGNLVLAWIWNMSAPAFVSGWYSPLTIDEDESLCPEQDEMRRIAVTASRDGDSIVVLDGNEGSIGSSPAYLLRVSEAIRWSEGGGGCQSCVDALIVAQP
jgi:hypothetical protein